MLKLVHTLLLLALVVLQIQLWMGEGSVAEMVAIKKQIAQQERENERLYRRNRLLATEVIELQNGLQTLEEQARLDLGMIKKDETFYLIYD
ncbi:septum formation initiator family protein [Endozoicomonas sp. 8E]|uniref:septum formation initiator family protein n=1 Tax=Endozoicomonas sp. 8E TaxID=3035692 RepID=UPI0029391F17|nr:septum formation initiator family protein [Endozoicomonas sp. 8E]WOG25455.1 septum formation initiator family protein [Endozoicomonas sp. 8E]